jgi:four helix bundle protein
MSNIAEGFENQSKQQFIRYLYIARGSCGELRSQLYVAYDVGYLDDNLMKELRKEATAISKQFSGLISYLENYQPPSDRVQESNRNEFFKIITQYYKSE